MPEVHDVILNFLFNKPTQYWRNILHVCTDVLLMNWTLLHRTVSLYLLNLISVALMCSDTTMEIWLHRLLITQFVCLFFHIFNNNNKLIYKAQFDTNGILIALYIVIMYMQMQYVHVWTYIKQSYPYTYTRLHINTYTITCTNIYLPTY